MKMRNIIRASIVLVLGVALIVPTATAAQAYDQKYATRTSTTPGEQVTSSAQILWGGRAHTGPGRTAHIESLNSAGTSLYSTNGGATVTFTHGFLQQGRSRCHFSTIYPNDKSSLDCWASIDLARAAEAGSVSGNAATVEELWSSSTDRILVSETLEETCLVLILEGETVPTTATVCNPTDIAEAVGVSAQVVAPEGTLEAFLLPSGVTSVASAGIDQVDDRLLLVDRTAAGFDPDHVRDASGHTLQLVTID